MGWWGLDRWSHLESAGVGAVELCYSLWIGQDLCNAGAGVDSLEEQSKSCTMSKYFLIFEPTNCRKDTNLH